MAQNARSHRKLKIAGIVALVVVVALLGFAGNFLFDFALNPQAPYTMKMMQDSKNDKKGEQPDAEGTEARAWFKENRESSSLTADDGTELAAWYFAASENTHDYAVCLHGYTNEPIGMARYVKRFHDRGMNVLAPAARAHERSGGDYIGMGWPERLDVVAWIGRIVQADPEARILVFGESMGAATAMNVAGESLPANVKCIIEDCGYTSVWDEFSLQLKDVFCPVFPCSMWQTWCATCAQATTFIRRAAWSNSNTRRFPCCLSTATRTPLCRTTCSTKTTTRAPAGSSKSSPSMAPPTPRVRKLTPSSTGTRSTTSSTSIFRQKATSGALSDPLFSEVCGKIWDCRPDRSFTNNLSGVLLPKNVVCSAISKFTAYFRKAARGHCAHGRLLLTLRYKCACFVQ